MPDALPLPPGVVYSFTPPSGLSDSISRAVADAIALIPPEKHGAVVTVVTEKGTNLVLIGRSSGGAFQAQGWIGKSGWDTPIRDGWEFGGRVALVF